jgi:glycogen debranching enzyme
MGEELNTNVAFNAGIWPTLPREQRQAIVAQAVAHPGSFYSQLISLVRATPGYGVYASLGPNYQYAVFGRDSLEFAEDILDSRPELSLEILLACAKLQGRRLESISEEEVGKIHHEYRARQFGGESISDVANQIFGRLSTQWGGDDKQLCYYGSIDTTPLFLRLLHRYHQMYGPEVLDETLTDHNGDILTLRQHARLSAEWLRNYVSASEWDMLEYRRLNPMGLPNQAWKDSEVSYLHLDGQRANADDGIASVEVQGYAYDALLAAAELVAADDEEVNYFQQLARQLQQQTLERLWMPGEQFFAMGLDRDSESNTRQIKTLSSNAAALLDSQLLLDLPNDQRMNYVEPIIHTIMGQDFLTEVGIRTRALRHIDLIDFADYHGSQVSWPKETYDIAKGMRRHGYHIQADDLEDRLLAAAQRSGEFYEFYYTNRDGKVKYHYRNEHPDEPQFHELGVALLPEPGQAWTLSAILAIIGRRNGGGSMETLH